MATKRKRHEEHENHERWLVSYADFITLLFAFFVVMYATSTKNEEKEKQFEESIKLELRLVGAGGGTGSAGKETLEQTLLELAMPIGAFPTRGGPREVEDYVERSIGKSMNSAQKKSAIQDIYHDAVGVRIALAASTFFPEASAKIKMSALPALDSVAEVLKTHKKRIIVEGHTDDLPIASPQFPSNWELAGGRASAVVRYFVKYHKLDPKRFVSLSYGDQKPVVPNDSEDHRSMNRRIEIFIVTDDKKVEI